MTYIVLHMNIQITIKSLNELHCYHGHYIFCLHMVTKHYLGGGGGGYETDYRILPVSTRGVFKQLWVPVYVNDIKKPTQGVIIYPKHPCKQYITNEIHNDLYLLQHRKSCIEELE